MKVEIKEIKKERKDGWYKVKYADKQEIARYYNSNWYVVGVGTSIQTRSIKVLDNNPIVFEEPEIEHEPFSPIELSLTIESKEELQELWHRMNMLIVRFKEFDYNVKSYQYNFKNGNSKSIIIWDKLDEVMKERNIKP